MRGTKWDDMNGRFEHTAKEPYHFLSSETFAIEKCEALFLFFLALSLSFSLYRSRAVAFVRKHSVCCLHISTFVDYGV